MVREEINRVMNVLKKSNINVSEVLIHQEMEFVADLDLEIEGIREFINTHYSEIKQLSLDAYLKDDSDLQLYKIVWASIYATILEKAFDLDSLNVRLSKWDIIIGATNINDPFIIGFTNFKEFIRGKYSKKRFIKRLGDIKLSKISELT